MRQRVKDDFESMAAQTRRSVTDEEGEAQHSVRDFAWRLVFLGRVFDAMPGCQDLVRMEINILLDTFLDQGEKDRGRANWKKLLVSDFKRFSDVLTVVWNNQTVATQKNASSTVNGIVGKSLTCRGPGDVQHVTEVVNGPTLLAWCEVFEREFGRNFAEWHSGGLTLQKLSETVVTLASTLRPCEVGRWIHAVRNTLLVLLGQIFAYFAISKSGPATRV